MSSSVSVIILDCNACSWGFLWEKWQKKEDIVRRLITSIVVYTNTYLSTSVSSSLIIIAAGSPLENRVIFSSEACQKDVDISEKIDIAIRSALKVSTESDEKFVHTNYSSAFATGICCKSNFHIYQILIRCF